MSDSVQRHEIMEERGNRDAFRLCLVIAGLFFAFLVVLGIAAWNTRIAFLPLAPKAVEQKPDARSQTSGRILRNFPIIEIHRLPWARATISPATSSPSVQATLGCRAESPGISPQRHRGTEREQCPRPKAQYPMGKAESLVIGHWALGIGHSLCHSPSLSLPLSLSHSPRYAEPTCRPVPRLAARGLRVLSLAEAMRHSWAKAAGLQEIARSALPA